MGYRDYLSNACPEAVFGQDEEESEIQDSQVQWQQNKSQWEYSSNGYCEHCEAMVFEDKGICPDCNQPTKDKYHWHKKHTS